MKKLNAAIDKMNRVLWAIAAIMLFLIAIAVSYDVVSRYFFNRSHEWVGEYSGYMLVCVSFLVAPFAISIGGMTYIDLVQNKVNNKVKRILIILAYCINIAYLLVLCVQSSKLAFTSFSLNWLSATTTRTPLWIPQVTIPIGSILMMLTTVLLLIRAIMTPAEPDRPREKISDDELARQILAEAMDTAEAEDQLTDHASGKDKSSGKKEVK